MLHGAHRHRTKLGELCPESAVTEQRRTGESGSPDPEPTAGGSLIYIRRIPNARFNIDKLKRTTRTWGVEILARSIFGRCDFVVHEKGIWASKERRTDRETMRVYSWNYSIRVFAYGRENLAERDGRWWATRLRGQAITSSRSINGIIWNTQ